MVYDLGSGEWNNPALRPLLDRIIPERGMMDNFEVEQEFPTIGRRIMLLNARKIYYAGGANTTLLLAIEDITDRRNAERLLTVLSEQKDILLAEMGHRVGNSLQIVASILMLKARSMHSKETKEQLEDAYRRVLSVATLQNLLKASGKGEHVDAGTYLSTLCRSLSESMIGEKASISLEVLADRGDVPSEQAVSLGLIVTELVINALKHAFPPGVEEGRVVVRYEVNGKGWTLSVSDNGVDIKPKSDKARKGVGVTLVTALSQQLAANVETKSGSKGTTVSIIRDLNLQPPE